MILFAGWAHRVVRTRHSYSFCNWLPVKVDLFKMKKTKAAFFLN